MKPVFVGWLLGVLCCLPPLLYLQNLAVPRDYLLKTQKSLSSFSSTPVCFSELKEANDKIAKLVVDLAAARDATTISSSASSSTFALPSSSASDSHCKTNPNPNTPLYRPYPLPSNKEVLGFSGEESQDIWWDDLFFKFNHVYREVPSKILVLGADALLPKHRAYISALNQGGWTAFENGLVVNFTWFNGAERCHRVVTTSDTDAAIHHSKLSEIDWQVVIIANTPGGDPTVEVDLDPTLDANLKAAAKWWSSSTGRHAHLMIYNMSVTIKKAMELGEELKSPKMSSPLGLLAYYEAGAISVNGKIEALMKLSTPAFTALETAPLAGYGGDRVLEDVLYSLSLRIATSDAYVKRRVVPSFADVQNALWWWVYAQGNDIYNLTKFPCIDEIATRWDNLAGGVWDQLIALRKPKMIVELGVFKGGSSFAAASCLEQHKLHDSFLVSIDTWLDDYCFTGSHARNNPKDQYCKYPNAAGGSLMYYNFIKGIVASNHTSRIIPLPSSANNAAAVFLKYGWTPDLIFVDASHAYVDLTFDMENWWLILACDGVMFGDDYGFAGVQQAVNLFAFKRGLQASQYLVGTKYWVFPPKKC